MSLFTHFVAFFRNVLIYALCRILVKCRDLRIFPGKKISIPGTKNYYAGLTLCSANFVKSLFKGVPLFINYCNHMLNDNNLIFLLMHLFHIFYFQMLFLDWPSITTCRLMRLGKSVWYEPWPSPCWLIIVSSPTLLQCYSATCYIATALHLILVWSWSNPSTSYSSPAVLTVR